MLSSALQMGGSREAKLQGIRIRAICKIKGKLLRMSLWMVFALCQPASLRKENSLSKCLTTVKNCY